MLSHLVYASRSTLPDNGGVGEILSVARRRNQASAVTGLLLYDGTHFLQLLEGDRATLSRLFLAIAGDPRHEDVTLLSVGATDERSCHRWAMGYLHHRPAIEDAVRQFSGSSAFRPDTMSAASAHGLLRHAARSEGVVQTSAAV